MKIEKAITILENDLKVNAYETGNLAAAVKLGIEALKRVEQHRLYAIPSSAILLPGETKDIT